MRVAIVLFGELADRSGGFRYDYHLVRKLREEGHEVIPVSQPQAHDYRGQFRIARDGWVEDVTASQPDLVLIDELNHAATLFGMGELRERLPGIPIVAIVHHLRCDERPLRWMARAVEGAFLRRCDGWLCNSSVTLHRARRVAGRMRSSAVVFPAAQHEDAPAVAVGEAAGGGAVAGDQSVGIDQGEPSRGPAVRVVFVGNVIPRKNIHHLIPAVLATDGVELDIYGDDSVDPRYTLRLRSIVGRSPRIRFHGRVTDRELEESLARADVLAVPSAYEGFGIVYLEALAAGVPVLATRRGGAREIVTDPLVGTLVAPRRRAIARAIRDLAGELRRDSLDGAGARAERRNAALQRAAAFPGWDHGMRGAVQFLEAIAPEC